MPENTLKPLDEESRRKALLAVATLAAGNHPLTALAAEPMRMALHAPDQQMHDASWRKLADKEGKLPASAIGEIFKKNRCIVFGDTNHTNEGVAQAVANLCSEMKKAGVRTMFMEMQKKDFDFLNTPREAFKGTAAQYLGFLQNRSRMLVDECKKHGIEVRLFDSASKEMENFFKQLEKDGFNPYTGYANDPKRTEEYRRKHADKFAALLEERQRINESWNAVISSYAKKNPTERFALFCGDGHVSNNAVFNPKAINYKDIDEMLGESGVPTVYCRVQGLGMEDVNIVKGKQTLYDVQAFSKANPRASKDLLYYGVIGASKPADTPELLLVAGKTFSQQIMELMFASKEKRAALLAVLPPPEASCLRIAEVFAKNGGDFFQHVFKDKEKTELTPLRRTLIEGLSETESLLRNKDGLGAIKRLGKLKTDIEKEDKEAARHLEKMKSEMEKSEKEKPAGKETDSLALPYPPSIAMLAPRVGIGL